MNVQVGDGTIQPFVQVSPTSHIPTKPTPSIKRDRSAVSTVVNVPGKKTIPFKVLFTVFYVFSCSLFCYVDSSPRIKLKKKKSTL